MRAVQARHPLLSNNARSSEKSREEKSTRRMDHPASLAPDRCSRGGDRVAYYPKVCDIPACKQSVWCTTFRATLSQRGCSRSFAENKWPRRRGHSFNETYEFRRHGLKRHSHQNSCRYERLERFRAERIPFCAKKARQNKNLGLRFQSNQNRKCSTGRSAAGRRCGSRSRRSS